MGQSAAVIRHWARALSGGERHAGGVGIPEGVGVGGKEEGGGDCTWDIEGGEGD